MAERYADYRRIARNINKCGLKRLREYCTKKKRPVKTFDRDLAIVKMALQYGTNAPVCKYNLSRQRIDQIMRNYERYALTAMELEGGNG